MKTYVVTYFTKYAGEEQEAKHILDAKNVKDAVDKTRQFVKSQLNHHAFRLMAEPLMMKREHEMRDICKQIYGRREDYDGNMDLYMKRIYNEHGRALLSLSERCDT